MILLLLKLGKNTKLRFHRSVFFAPGRVLSGLVSEYASSRARLLQPSNGQSDSIEISFNRMILEEL